MNYQGKNKKNKMKSNFGWNLQDKVKREEKNTEVLYCSGVLRKLMMNKYMYQL